MNRIKFFMEYLKDFRTTGSVTPSSRFLAKKMIKNINFSHADCIVEFGAGTGVFTRTLLKRMNKDAVLLSFETNKDFCTLLKHIDDPRLQIINDSAEHIQKYITKVDYIVSGLPLVSLPRTTITKIIDSIRTSLHSNGSYIQFQYSLKSYKEFKEKFNSVRINFTPLNLPPAVIYTCTP